MKYDASLRQLAQIVPFLSWVKTQTGKYDYSSNTDCPMARYIRTKLELVEGQVSAGSDRVTVHETNIDAEVPPLHTTYIFGQALANALVDDVSTWKREDGARAAWTYEKLAERLLSLG